MYKEIKFETSIVLNDEEYLKFKQALESAKRQGLDLTEEKFASHLLTYGANSRLMANMDNIINIENFTKMYYIS